MQHCLDLACVNGGNQLQDLRRGGQTWKFGMIEEEFPRPRFDAQDMQSHLVSSLEKREMSAISVEQAQAELPKLIEQLKAGEEIEITKNDQTVAKLIGQKTRRQFGLGKGKLTVIQEDDEHLEDFKEYMP
ncbi:MAG TPA: hypothetical protein VHC19_11210 [Pirellulales bacterium]|nr:hypothetical protein [Pirellulales bacterium]